MSFSSQSPKPKVKHWQQAENRFFWIIDHFQKDANCIIANDLNGPKLLRYFYLEAPSQRSKENILRAFFSAVNISINEYNVNMLNDLELRKSVLGFAENIFFNFFWPARARRQKESELTEEFRSASQCSNSRNLEESARRRWTLREQCLKRDKHRCLISGKFDLGEAEKRYKHESWQDEGILDDDQKPIEAGKCSYLHVAHILPHSLINLEYGPVLGESQKACIEILNVFDDRISDLVNGNDVDKPRNTLSLTGDLHRQFAMYRLYFTHLYVTTYRFETDLPFIFDKSQISEKDLSFIQDSTIEPLSQRLLAIHRSIARILSFSGAGRCIDRIFEDMDKGQVESDGSTDLGIFIRLRIDRWLDV